MNNYKRAAMVIHELYISLILAGFTEHQALYLAGQAMGGSSNPDPDIDSSGGQDRAGEKA